MHKHMNTIVKEEILSGQGPFSISYQVNNPNFWIVTGDNATGKSIVRKLMTMICEDDKTHCIHLSQQLRCRVGIHRAFLYGSEEDDSTGYNTVGTFNGLMRTCAKLAEKAVVVWDEPEIGCGEELQAGLGFALQSKISDLTMVDLWVIITHSREFVKQLLTLNPSHLRLKSHEQDFINLNEWCQRKIVPITDLDSVVERGRLGYKYILNRKKKND